MAFTFQQTIEYLYSRLPMFSKLGAAAYKKDIHNTYLLCQAYNHPEQKFKTIHIAGTNGKGSVSHMLAAIFQTAGYKTGLYTSPHLNDFRERIKINGEFISEQFVIDFTEKSIPLINEISPSFFEITVVMAFEYFATEQVDIAIIETGLGGRLDSTNIIFPELSIITNIGWDHMNILGNTLEKIAYEKAGIIKRNIPVVIGESTSETKTVFEQVALEHNSDIYFADTQYTWKEKLLDIKSGSLKGTATHINNSIYIECDLSGIYQLKNICTVLTAVEVLNRKGYNLSEENTQKALKSVKNLTGLYGRWDIVHRDPLVILDVAHNEDGIKQVLTQLSVIEPKASKVKVVIGMVKDKDVESVLELFPKHYEFYFTNAHIPRALPASELKQKAHSKKLMGESYEDVNDAINAAIKNSSTNDIIIVCGSVFLIGEVSQNDIKKF